LSLEAGAAKSLREIAALEGVDNSYVSRMVNLTTLAPDIVDAILLNELPDHLTLFDLASDTPLSWAAQRALLNLRAGKQTGELKLLGCRLGAY